MDKIKIEPKDKISGIINIPGDKSITHRAVILGSLAEGKTYIHNFLDGDDCRRTVNAFRQMGVSIKEEKEKIVIESNGYKHLKKPRERIDAGNSGTTVRLLSGVIAGREFSAEFTGDASLSRRPMRRVIEPLRKMGAKITARDDKYLPMTIEGNPSLKAIEYELPVASAQVKSCILLAGLQAEGITSVAEPVKTRDHSERMMKYFGIDIQSTEKEIKIKGRGNFKGKEIHVPGDFSSAAFFIVAGLILPDSVIEIKNVGVNPGRTGLIEVLREMGAKIRITNIRQVNNEAVADIVVQSSKLKGVLLERLQTITNMIDEIPVLCLAATQAEGETVIKNAGELRVKESDRISAISAELNKLGAGVKELPDGFIIEGRSKLKGAKVNSHDDHRIAMTLAVAGLAAKGNTVIDNPGCINISFPGFFDILNKI